MAAHDHETFARLTSRKESQVGRLRLATLISGVYLCLEVVGGILSNSLALLADAGHMLVDVAALSVAYLAARLASLPPSPRRTWGLLRAEVIGAFVNGAALVIMVGFIVMRAVQRLSDPPHIRGPLMVAVALGGLAANVASAAVLFRARNESINLRGAFAHVVADALGSIGAMLAGVVISATGWVAADALASMGIGGLVLYSGLGIVRESLDILMQATPRGIDFEEVREALAGLEHVAEVYDLHIWTVTSGFPALSAHLSLKPSCSDTTHWQQCLKDAQDLLRERFGIVHSTLQVEPVTYARDARPL